MKGKSTFWKKYFDSRSEGIASDNELDRGSFASHNEEIEQSSAKVLLDFIEPKLTDFVFDAGCGTGVNLSKLFSRVNRIIGMDYSMAVIKRAKNRVERENIGNVQLTVGSIADIGFRSNSFDKIICISVLHYLNDEECESALKEFVRISKDGGIVVLHVKNLFSLYISTLYLAKRVKGLFRKGVIIEHYRSFKWYWRMLSKVGAEVLNYDSRNIILLDFIPKFLYYKLQKVEMKYCKSRILKKYGADLVIKAKVRKGKETIE